MIKNIKYNGFDNNLLLHSTKTYQRTEFISNSLRNEQFKKAKEFVMSHDGQRQ